MGAWFTEVAPRVITPSSGIRSPGRTTTVAPTGISPTGFSSMFPSLGHMKRALGGVISKSAVISRFAFSRLHDSSSSAREKRKLTEAASSHSPKTDCPEDRHGHEKVHIRLELPCRIEGFWKNKPASGKDCRKIEDNRKDRRRRSAFPGERGEYAPPVERLGNKRRYQQKAARQRMRKVFHAFPRRSRLPLRIRLRRRLLRGDGLHAGPGDRRPDLSSNVCVETAADRHPASQQIEREPLIASNQRRHLGSEQPYFFAAAHAFYSEGVSFHFHAFTPVRPSESKSS